MNFVIYFIGLVLLSLTMYFYRSQEWIYSMPVSIASIGLFYWLFIKMIDSSQEIIKNIMERMNNGN